MNTQESQSNPINIRKLARLTGADRASIARWIGGAPTEEAALAIIRERQGKRTSAATAVDPVTGLSWFQRLQREKTIKLARENKIADKVAAKEWMPRAEHCDCIKALVDRIELLPGKCKSQLGLSDAQTIGLRDLCDQLRNEAADEIEAQDREA